MVKFTKLEVPVTLLYPYPGVILVLYGQRKYADQRSLPFEFLLEIGGGTTVLPFA